MPRQCAQVTNGDTVCVPLTDQLGKGLTLASAKGLCLCFCLPSKLLFMVNKLSSEQCMSYELEIIIFSIPATTR